MRDHDADGHHHPRHSGSLRARGTKAVVALVAAASAVGPTYAHAGGSGPDDPALATGTASAVRSTATAGHGGAHSAATDAHGHDHADPATRNAISRSADVGTPTTADPTTPRQAAAAADAVAAQRAEPDPRTVPLARPAPRRDTPEDRYAMAGGCYAMRSTDTEAWVRRYDTGYRADSTLADNGEPFHFQATDLGTYLLYGTRQDFVSAASAEPAGLGGGSAVESADEPSGSADWTVRQQAGAFLFSLPNRNQGLAVNPQGDLVMADRPSPFELRRTLGCAAWPEVETNISGRTFRGVSGIQEVRGYVDAHTHGMAFEFLGGDVHCGRPWHPYGVEHALRDCPDHYPADGRGAVLENLLRTGNPAAGHDPMGWPTFKDWPAPRSLTHEGTYYRWLERAYRGGVRLFVNLLVENNKLCEIYPIKHNSCDDMDSVRLQAKDMRALERYIDAQAGGPGEGWYRIVTNPFEARQVINDGKMAVVIGIETSVLFGCTMKADVPQCSTDSIDRQLDEVHTMGVRQMELVNKFDNAMSGVAGDEGQTGVAVNSANFLETGSFWDMRTCPSTYPADVRDKNQVAAPDPNPFDERDALFGAIEEQFGVKPPVSLPAYGSTPHCNQRGLTPLGAHAVDQMARRHMLFDPDHMSVAGRKASLDMLESRQYPGVVSSHSWSTPDAYPRIYRMGGVITPYAGDSTGFVEKWKQHLRWADPRYYFGFGYGADINGLGAQGDPRGADTPNPVTYPFTGLGGVTVHKQRSGQRVYDINVDGVAHYGLYPDWIEDLRKLAGDAIVEDMSRGTEAYLATWERAVGIGNDGCRDPRALRPADVYHGMPVGTPWTDVLRQGGQPHSRLGNTYTYCATSPSGAATTVEVTFDDSGNLQSVT